MTTPWTGEPLVEQCETHDFFEPKKVYRSTSKPMLAAELRGQFQCWAVEIHPSTRVLYAVGVFRSAHNRPWNPYVVSLVATNWKEGWEEIELPKEENQ